MTSRVQKNSTPKEKGCSTCTKRRIICDKSRPHCQKCVKRDLQCPGYGPKIRWAGGVAVRGRLRGLQIPVPEASPKYPDQSSTVDAFGGLSMETLLDYYDKNVARLMVWVDSDENHYRRRVLPLARSNQAVRLAVSAVAAQHAAGALGRSGASEKARNEVVTMITKRIKDLTLRVSDDQDSQAQLDSDTAEWMLSSMMVLSCYEMVHSGADAAEFHRKAARCLVNTVTALDIPTGGLLTFLRNQLSMYDVFACTTSFDTVNIQDAIAPNLDDDTVLFNKYLSLLHDVTLCSDQLMEVGSRDWRAEFERARGETLMATGRLPINSASDRRDFIRLVDIHHNAALLYIARRLGQGTEMEVGVALSDLFRLLQSIEDLPKWIHNLPWPAFIAGAECHGHGHRQAIVAGIYKKISEATGFRHFSDVLSFLEEFWAGREPDWRQLAKQWEDSGRRILAV